MKDNKLTKTDKQLAVMTVYDAENDKFIEVTPDIQRQAAFVQQNIMMGSLITAFGIKKMFDEKLYLGLGCSSRDEYIDNLLPFARRQAYRLYSIASKFDSATNLLLPNTDNSVPLSALCHGSDEEKVPLMALNSPEIAQNVGSLGFSKLFELSKMEDEEVANLIKKGKVDLPGGQLTMQDVIESTAKELGKKLADYKRKSQAELSRVNEKLKLIESEQADRAKTIDALTEENKIAKKIEAQFGGKASLLKDKFSRVHEAKNSLIQCSLILRNCGVTGDDPKELRDELLSIIKMFDSLNEEMIVEFADVAEKLI
jgi:polyhydroxyalkanoate synthesis regulator phasin